MAAAVVQVTLLIRRFTRAGEGGGGGGRGGGKIFCLAWPRYHTQVFVPPSRPRPQIMSEVSVLLFSIS